MSDDQDDAQKTEEPTDKKLRDAHKKGEVAKSQEVRHWSVLFALLLVIVIAGKSSLTSMGAMLTGFIGSAGDIRVEAGGGNTRLRRIVLPTKISKRAKS